MAIPLPTTLIYVINFIKSAIPLIIIQGKVFISPDREKAGNGLFKRQQPDATD